MKAVNIYDYLVIGAYFLFMLGIGLYFMKINKGAKEYFAGGSMIPWWVSGMTLYMANFSAWTFTGAAGFAYATGWFAICYFGTWSVCVLLRVAADGLALAADTVHLAGGIHVHPLQLHDAAVPEPGDLPELHALGGRAAGGHLQAPGAGDGTGYHDGHDRDRRGDSAVHVHGRTLGGVDHGRRAGGDPAEHHVHRDAACARTGRRTRAISWTRFPPLSFDHMYNGVHYTEHWLVSIFIIMCLGTAAGAAQRFYSVKDERDAKRVGKLAGMLFLTVPFVFGVPPLVASVIWPDLSQVDFFKPYMGSNPQDLVFIALCLKLLPNGLIGVFLAAMLAATMSTLSSVYNMVSSILSRDIYQGWIRPDDHRSGAADGGPDLLGGHRTHCRRLAVIFVNSQFGIFNLMQAFFTLLNIPVVVPTAFGLIFRRVPKWSAVGVHRLGTDCGCHGALCAGLGYRSAGLPVRLSASFGIFVGIVLAREGLHRRRRACSVVLVVAVAAALRCGVPRAPFRRTRKRGSMDRRRAQRRGAGRQACIVFAHLFAAETAGERAVVEEFFKKLDTPVDVATEVFGAGRKQISTFPLVGGTTVVMGLLMSLIFFTDISAAGAGRARGDCRAS